MNKSINQFINELTDSILTNEYSILNFRGEIAEKSRWLRDPQMFEDENEEQTILIISIISL